MNKNFYKENVSDSAKFTKFKKFPNLKLFFKLYKNSILSTTIKITYYIKKPKLLLKNTYLFQNLPFLKDYSYFFIKIRL